MKDKLQEFKDFALKEKDEISKELKLEFSSSLDPETFVEKHKDDPKALIRVGKLLGRKNSLQFVIMIFKMKQGIQKRRFKYVMHWLQQTSLRTDIVKKRVNSEIKSEPNDDENR